MTTINTSTTNFSKFVQELIRKELEDNLRGTLPHLEQGAINAKFVKGSNNIMRFLRITDIDTDGNLTNTGTISAVTQPWLTEGTAPTAEALTFGYEEFTSGQAGRREGDDSAMERGKAGVGRNHDDVARALAAGNRP